MPDSPPESGIPLHCVSEFIAAAPTGKLPDDETHWLKIPVFGDVLCLAVQKAASLEDKRILKKSMDYWFLIYAKLSSKIRTTLTLMVYAMLDAFRGRDIPAIISSETNFTPESIMSGKIVVLDLPLKELKQTGLIVQSAIKYLFQTALEHRGKANDPSRRPVFLWEDEGQYFFSDHDFHFQDTARSSRVSRVILTQNVHSFYKELGQAGVEAAKSIFGNLNTKIFHANTDDTTNEWAARIFGQEIHTRLTVGYSPPPPPPPTRDLGEAIMNFGDSPRSGASVSTTEHWEYAVRPEEFNLLRNGGELNGWQVDAYITWLGMGGQGQKHFTHVTFNQNPNL